MKKLFAGYKSTPGSVEYDTAPQLPGKYGFILPYDDQTLSVFVTGARRLKKLALIPGAAIFSEGDGEGTVHLPNARLDEAAAIIGAKRRRTVSEAERARLAKIGAAHRFEKARL